MEEQLNDLEKRLQKEINTLRHQLKEVVSRKIQIIFGLIIVGLAYIVAYTILPIVWVKEKIEELL